jgi:hypothetical protein
MAEITLADYTGYIFLEIIKAREMADRHSSQLAEVYAQDPVLRHFPVPRFKVPKLELTIPLLISGARFNQLISFNLPQDKFVAYVMGRVKEVISVVQSKGDDPFVKRIAPAPVVVKTVAAPPAGDTAPRADVPSIEALCVEFWQRLKENPDPSQPGEIVRRMWTLIFERALIDRDLMELYKKSNPNNELYRASLEDVLKAVTTATVVDSTTIQSLLVNPETNVVKNGSSDTSVFTLKAEMLEEGFFIRTVRDESTGQTRPVVEFE